MIDVTLSVIIPVYNVEAYIDRCINSVLNQTYKNIQIILVDDGSTDSSGMLCDDFASLDSRIVVIHQRNKGLSQTRFEGLKCAKGDYIIWVDSDDWIEETYFEQMMAKAVRSGCDLVVANLFCDTGKESRIIKNNISPGIYDVEDIVNNMLYTGIFFEYGIWPHGVTKLYKRNILNEIENKMDFNITIGEDAAIVYPYILKSERIYLTDICCYHYVQRADSITKKNIKNEIKKIESLICYLSCIFEKNNILMSQLQIYKNYLLALRDISYWDEIEIMHPYGGVDSTKGIVIYGAGGMGLSLYSYCKKKRIPIIAWIDKNYKYYQSIGMPVIGLDEYIKTKDKCTDIYIANISEIIAREIRKDLLMYGIEERKIKWFSHEFINGRV